MGTCRGEFIIEVELDVVLNRLEWWWWLLFDIKFIRLLLLLLLLEIELLELLFIMPAGSELVLNWIAWNSFCVGSKPFVRLFELAFITVFVVCVVDVIWFSWCCCCWIWWKFWKLLLFNRYGLFSSFS